MFLIRGVGAALLAMFNPLHPWNNVGRDLLSVVHATAVNITRLVFVVLLIGGIVRFLGRVF